ncbi:MAG: tRNA (adenosine(37)-N6)-threonylcarbamoyltransferase complex dimerization subunit type 1 TsaB [Pyrinomonadaceae bacterium]
MVREITLAIESGIGGGSLSILEKDLEIDCWTGSYKITKSEELLSNISELLAKNSLAKSDLKKIAISSGPGSYTGVRTGISTAKGLQKSLGLEFYGISALEAFVLKTNRAGEVFTSFAAGRNQVCWQFFKTDGDRSIENINTPQISFLKDFLLTIRKHENAELIVYKDLIQTDGEVLIDFGSINPFKIEENAARYIGLRSLQVSPSDEIFPVYARDANAV